MLDSFSQLRYGVFPLTTNFIALGYACITAEPNKWNLYQFLLGSSLLVPSNDIRKKGGQAAGARASEAFHLPRKTTLVLD